MLLSYLLLIDLDLEVSNLLFELDLNLLVEEGGFKKHAVDAVDDIDIDVDFELVVVDMDLLNSIVNLF